MPELRSCGRHRGLDTYIMVDQGISSEAKKVCIARLDGDARHSPLRAARGLQEALPNWFSASPTLTA